MAEGLEDLCGRSSLTGGEKKGIQIVEGEIEGGHELGERCLIGKVGRERKVNKEAFQLVLSKI
jgi:hypothetical protein